MADEELSKAMIAASKEAAEKIIPYSKAMVPVISGRLKKSIKASATRSRARVTAGSKVRVPYAVWVHGGRYFPSTGKRTKHTKFLSDAIPKAYPEIIDAYVDQMNEIAKRFRRKHGAHQAKGRYGSGGK